MIDCNCNNEDSGKEPIISSRVVMQGDTDPKAEGEWYPIDTSELPDEKESKPRTFTGVLRKPAKSPFLEALKKGGLI